MWEELVDRQCGFAMFTPELARALRETRVAVLGAGGNGVVLDHLVRLGFERFILVDPDTVEASNLNRLPFTMAEIGLPKVEAWRRYLLSINPDCEIRAHPRSLTKLDGPWLTDLLQDSALVFAGTTSVEANVLIGRVCARLQRRMIVGPASSGAYVVSTFTHERGITLESVAGMGTEDLSLEEIDYAAIASKFQTLAWHPGRRRRLAPGVAEAVRSGRLNPRSCKIFVSLTNAAMAFEAVKNVAELHGLPLEAGAKVVRAPVFHIFDPYSGCAYYYNVGAREIGIPDWLTGAVSWRPYVEE
jgi:molybdopterin/thiamine biosynthesis adenylyltransferase